jgi:hypothetical protein
MKPPRRRPRRAATNPALPPEVPETAKADAPAPAAPAPDADVLPDDLRKMLEAGYT